MFQLFIALALFLAPVVGQPPLPDVNCSAWLATPEGQAFTACETGFPGFPLKSRANNCQLTVTDYDNLCLDACLPRMMQSYDFFLTTGTCLKLYEYYFGPCLTDTDCSDPNLPPQFCNEGVCYRSCNTSATCNPCYSETCVSVGKAMGCRSNFTQISGHSTFRGIVHQLSAVCSQNPEGNYCGLLYSNITGANLTTFGTQCSDFDNWGCCLGTMLKTSQYCDYQHITEPFIYNCSLSNLTCGTLPQAQAFCAYNITSNGNSSSTSSSSTSSSMTGSSIIGSGSSMISSFSSFSSVISGVISLTGSTGGSTGVATTGDNSAGMVSINWSLLLVLALIVPTLS